jgi:hypothetical protein
MKLKRRRYKGYSPILVLHHGGSKSQVAGIRRSGLQSNAYSRPGARPLDVHNTLTTNRGIARLMAHARDIHSTKKGKHNIVTVRIPKKDAHKMLVRGWAESNHWRRSQKMSKPGKKGLRFGIARDGREFGISKPIPVKYIR